MVGWGMDKQSIALSIVGLYELFFCWRRFVLSASYAAA